MGYTSLFLLFVAVAVATADDSCPPRADIAPCTCDGEGFSCLGPVNMEQMRKAFKAHFKYGGVRALWIQATQITSVPSDLFNGIKVQQAYIEMNNVTSVDLRSLLAGSKENLYILSLFGNKLTTFDYDTLPHFDIMTTLNIAKNSLTTIPDGAFRSNFLRTLILAQNQISHIGRDAFKGLINIIGIDLSQNEITTLGPYSFHLVSPQPQISLDLNKISSVSDTAFIDTTPGLLRMAANQMTSLPYDAFGDLVTRMGQNGLMIDVTSNPFTCKGCDYTWVANNKDLLARVLYGFACPSGHGLDSLTRDNISC